MFAASGEHAVWVEEHRGYTRRLEPDALDRLAARAGWPVERRPWTRRPGFEHDGTLYVENRQLVALAQDFAATNPDLVTLYIDGEEAQLRSEVMAGSTFHRQWLIDQGPQHSIARDWAGGAARHHLTEEIHFLREQLYRALNELRKADAGKAADRIERALQRGR